MGGLASAYLNCSMDHITFLILPANIATKGNETATWEAEPERRWKERSIKQNFHVE